MLRASKGQRRCQPISDWTHGYFVPLSFFVLSPVPLFTDVFWVFLSVSLQIPDSPAGRQTGLVRSFIPKGISLGRFLNCPLASPCIKRKQNTSPFPLLILDVQLQAKHVQFSHLSLYISFDFLTILHVLYSPAYPQPGMQNSCAKAANTTTLGVQWLR